MYRSWAAMMGDVKLKTMFLFLLLYVFIFAAAREQHLINIKSSAIRGINFKEKIFDKALDWGIFLQVRVANEGDCALKCAATQNCFSYNFRSSRMCQLLDRLRHGYGMTPSQGTVYRGIKNPCDDTNSCGEKEHCVPNAREGTRKCKCKHGYHKDPCELIPKSCSELFKRGKHTSGSYVLLPKGLTLITAVCDMDTNGGGWTVIQRRRDNKTEFNQNWGPYKHGFGKNDGNFWIGNNKIHQMTKYEEMVVRFDIEDFHGNKMYAEYDNFTVLNESNGYQLFFGTYSGTAGDNLRKHYGMKFATRDRDNDRHCSSLYHGGWWYNYCHRMNINGLYLLQEGEHNITNPEGMSWYSSAKENFFLLKTTEMKIRPKTHM